MAQEIVGIKIVVDGQEKILSSMKDIRQELKRAQSDAVIFSETFGSTSKQATEAAQRVARLKDAIGDAKNLTDAYNPDAKFKAFSQALQGVVGGVAAVQGAIGLLGVENEAVEKTLLRVQSAMALSQGLNSVLESIDSFKTLGKQLGIVTAVQRIYNFVMGQTAVATAATTAATNAAVIGMRVLRGVMATLGIGALIAGVTILISKISDWTSSTDEAAEAQKRLATQTDLINSKLNNEIAILTSLGGKEAEIFKKKQEIANNELTLLREKFKNQGKFSIEEAKKFGELKTQLVTLEIDEKNRIKKVNEDAQKEKDKKNKEAADKEKAAAEERINANKQAEDEIRKLRQDAELNAITDQNKRKIRQAEIDYENRKIEIEGLKASEKLKTELLVEEQKKRDKAIADAKAEASQAELTDIVDRLFAENEIEEKERKRIKDAEDKDTEDLIDRLMAENEAERKAAEANKQISDEEAKVKIDNAQKVAGILSGLSDLFGKETAAGKATAIAAATINTYLAASQALTGIKKMNPLGATLAIAQAALIVANGIKQVKEISKVKVPGGGGTAPSITSASAVSGSAPISPQAPIQNTLTQLDQGSINQLGSATNRAYVVESDVTNSQERIRRINRAARLN